MNNYEVTITVKPLVPYKDLDPIDQDEGPGLEYMYRVRTGSVDEAEERALDIFHSSVPIHVLDDYDIVAIAQLVQY